EGRGGLALFLHHEKDQHDEDEDVKPALLQRRPQPRQFVALQAAQALLGRIGVDLHREAEIEQQRRHGSSQRDLAIGNAEEARHHEGGGAHYRRHQHGAGRGHGLDAAGIVGAEAGALHRGNSDDAGRDHVGDHAAGDRALQGGGDHADLRCAAAHAADQREGDVVEEAAAAGVVERDAEDDEADDDLAEGLHRDAEGAFRRNDVIGQRVFQRLADAADRSWHHVGEDRIERHQRDDDEDRRAAGAAQSLEDQHPENGAENLGGRRRREFPALAEDALGLPGEPADAADRDQREQEVDHRQAVVRLAVPGIGEEDQRQGGAGQHEEVTVLDQSDVEEPQVELLVQDDHQRAESEDDKYGAEHGRQTAIGQILGHALGRR